MYWQLPKRRFNSGFLSLDGYVTRSQWGTRKKNWATVVDM